MKTARLLLCLACTCFVSGHSALAQKAAPQEAVGEKLTIDAAEMQKPWTGDLDAMIERRVIRVLTVNSKTLGGGQARTRPQRVVSERGVCSSREDRPGNDDLRQQHLQVLHPYRLVLESRAAEKEAIEKVKGGAK